MDYFWYSYVFVIGGVIGSFLNVCISRIPKRESIVTGRSHCEGCGRVLSFPEMIPVLSYLFLGGRCRKCKCRIPARYPLTEAATAALFTLTAVLYGFTPDTLLLCLFFCVLIVAAGIDLLTMEIPDVLHIWIFIAALFRFLLYPSMLFGGITGFFVLSVPCCCCPF